MVTQTYTYRQNEKVIKKNKEKLAKPINTKNLKYISSGAIRQSVTKVGKTQLRKVTHENGHFLNDPRKISVLGLNIALFF